MLEQWEVRARTLARFGLMAALVITGCSSDSANGDKGSIYQDDDAIADDDDDDDDDDDSGDDEPTEKKDAGDAGKKRDGGSGTGSAKDGGGSSSKDSGTKDVGPSAPKDGGPVDTPSAPLTPMGENCLQPGNGNYTSPGPYKVAQKDVDFGQGPYTIYYPNPFEANCLHPIVAWGNGTGVTDSNFTYDFLNSNAASWGMVVTAPAESNTGSGAFHKGGIDYLLKENMDSASMFYNKLSTRAGVSGHSQGGFGAVMAASHPNVVAAVVEGASFTATQKVPALVMTGTNDLGVGAADAVSRAMGPMFVAVWEGGNHIGTETVLGFLGLDSTSGDAAGSQKGAQQFQRLYAAWFRCFLANDQTACELFSGGAPDNCGICKDPGWARLASKNL